MLKILVTGGAGFIGSELVRQLVEEGFDVEVVDNLVNGKRENLSGILGQNCRLIVEDVRNSEELARRMADKDVVFHLSCLGIRHSIHSPRENHEVNATATLGLLEQARAVGVKRFVCVSSSEVYGTARSIPMSEAHPTHPNTVYGASKLAGECYARAFYQTYGYATTIVRPFNAYGPRSHHEGDSGEVIPKFVLRCLAGRPMIIFGDGTQTRDFTFVSDTARGILAAGMSESAVGQTINIGSGTEIPVLELARIVASTLGRTDAEILYDEPRPGDVLRLCADIGKAHDLLNFSARVGISEGIRRLHAWYSSCGVAPETLLEKEVVRGWEGKGERADV